MVFVTGGTGLLGSHLLVELTKQHDAITAIYRTENKIQTVKKCFEYYLGDIAIASFEKIQWKKCDILDLPRLEECMQEHKIVYHCAGLVSFKRKDFSKLIEVNRYGTANLINLSLDLEIEKFCHVSSTAAVGHKDIPENVEIDETGKWATSDETSGYSISKYSAEKEVWRGIHEGLNAVIVNPSIIFGAGNWNEGSLKIFDTLQKGLKFYPTGSNAFVDARDVAKIMVQLINKNIFNERFLCTGENTTFKDLFALIAEELNRKAPQYKVSQFIGQIAWRLSSFWGMLSFSTPILSKESVNSSYNHIKYSHKKIQQKLDYNFYSLTETVKNTVAGRLS